MALDLVCLGNLSIDDIFLPDHSARLNCFGGDAIYAALGARWWSDSVRFVAPVGADFPEEHLAYLDGVGMDTRGLPRRSIPGVHYRVVYADNNQRTWTMLSADGDFGMLSPAVNDIPDDYLDSRSFLILAMDLPAQESLASSLRPRGVIALDPQEEYIPGNEERVLAMLKNVDIFLPSEQEVFLLLGDRDCERACRRFAECGPSIVAVKIGEQGSLIYDSRKDRFYPTPAFRTKAVDTTGAGDTYSGGFMAMYIRSSDLLKAGLAGAVSASFAIQDFGLAHMFGVTREQAEQRLRTIQANSSGAGV